MSNNIYNELPGAEERLKLADVYVISGCIKIINGTSRKDKLQNTNHLALVEVWILVERRLVFIVSVSRTFLSIKRNRINRINGTTRCSLNSRFKREQTRNLNLISSDPPAIRLPRNNTLKRFTGTTVHKQNNKKLPLCKNVHRKAKRRGFAFALKRVASPQISMATDFAHASTKFTEASASFFAAAFGRDCADGALRDVEKLLT